MNLITFWNNLNERGVTGWILAGILILLSLIEISPLKINPLGAILGWIGKRMNSSMEKDLDGLRKQVQDMWVNGHRTAILSFAREARSGVQHSESEWTNILNMAREYEIYVDTHAIANGVVREDTAYIRSLYQKLSDEHKV